MRNFLKISFLFMVLAAGMFLFQAQDATQNGDNPYYDQPPKNYLYMQSFKPPPVNPAPLVITDANGYDNFDINVNTAEQWITQNPMDPFQMIFGVNITAWYHTEDGLTWVLNNPTSSSSGDPIAAYDTMGNGYAQLLGSGNRVWRTTNNGVSWGPGVPSVAGGDRNTMAVDQTGGPYGGYVYSSAWSPNANFARSTDFGATWTTTVSGAPNTTPGNMIAIGPNGNIQGGTVYWVCTVGTNPVPTIYNIYRSTNGGLNFTLVNTSIQPGYVGILIGSRLCINNCRTRPYPFIAADNSYGPYRGRFYIVYAGNDPPGNGNKPDVWCRYSTDQGSNFSAPVRVNDNANPTASDQWFPAIWCDKYNGRLYIKWYDDRNSPSNYGMDVYATYSTDGGQTFAPNQRLTNATWTYPCPGVSGGSYCGDYDGMVANKFSGTAIWTDMRNCNRTNMVSYFPDFAMKLIPNTFSLNGLNDSAFSYVSVPGVKLYAEKVRYTASVSPTPPAGNITISFLNRTNNSLQDTLTSYPDSLKVRVKTSGGVTSGSYTVTVKATGRIGGENGPPVHVRTISLTVLTGIANYNNEVPGNFYLYQNFPNPFNPKTNIRFDIAKAGHVRLIVFDVTGKQVAELINGQYSAGKYISDFDAAGLSSGIYFYKIEAEDYVNVKKMILVK